MKDVLVRSNRGKFSIISAILLGALALAVIAGLGAAADAASSSTTNEALLGELRLFNPFTLQSTSISAVDSESGTEADLGLAVLLGTMSRPPIRIPYRPPLRSPFRPPLIGP